MPNDYEALKKQVEESIRKSHFKTSKEMKEVLNALKDVCALREQPVGANVQQMMEAHERLGKACELYTSTRENARTSKGKNRLDMVSAIHSLQQQEQDGINAMRSPKVLQESQGKTWGDVLASQREKTIDITSQNVKTVGGGSSTRYIVETEDGKKGYFTENQNLITVSEYLESCAKKAVHPEVKEGILQAIGTNEAEVIVWQASNSLETDNFANTFSQTIEKAEYEPQRALFGYNEFSPAAKNEFYELMNGAGKLFNARETMVGDAGIQDGANISNRNIASSRLAELLGQENLIAHSQKLCIQNGEEKLHGVVMDQAVGMDFRSSNPDDKVKISQIADFSSPEFQRQITNLEIMDILSGQVDRNSGNMFYQLGDTADGKKCITGIQGIDNDAAFGLTTKSKREMVFLDEVTMIDSGLAENLMKIDRNVLDYTFGDILNPEEIGALENRLTKVKNHVLNDGVKVMQPDEWSKETAEMINGPGRYMSNVKKRVEMVKETLGLDEKSINSQKPQEPQSEGLKETVSEKAENEKAPTETNKAMENQKSEKHERKQIPLNELENMVKNEKKGVENSSKGTHQWESRTPTVPYNIGHRLTGELGLGQHHRTDFMKPSSKSGPSK